MAFPVTLSAVSNTLTKAEANALEEALPDEVAIEAACATADEAARTLGDDPVRFAVTQDAASASVKAESVCSRARAGRASPCCKLATAKTRHRIAQTPRFMASSELQAKRRK